MSMKPNDLLSALEKKVTLDEKQTKEHDRQSKH